MPRRRNRRAANQIAPNAGPNRPNNPQNVNGQENGEKLTPYQGSRRAFGMYKCTKCNRVWMSNCSWANFGQMCFKCNINVYPFRQYPLDSDEADKKDKCNPDKPHQQELCEKCRALGRFCGKSPEGKKKRRRNKKKLQSTGGNANAS